MLTPSIKLGEMNGVDFKISIGWIVVFIWLTTSLRRPEAYNQYLEMFNLLTLGQFNINPVFPQSQLAMLGFTITVILGVYLSVILHEIGHSTAAHKRGINVESISLWVAGGVAEIETIPSNKELSITAAGPFVTFLLILTYAVIATALFILNITTVAWVFLLLSLFNILMFLFNLLPLYPMDGGRILRSLLTYKASYVKSTEYAFYTTITSITTVVILMLAFSQYDYLFISAIIGLLSYTNYKQFKEKYNPENISIPDDFYVYEKKFKFDSGDITERQKNNIVTHLKNQGAQVAQDKEEADYIISTRPLELQLECETKYMNPLLLVHKLEQNGADLPQEFKDQFKIHPQQ